VAPVWSPQDAEQVAAAVKDALLTNETLELVGTGSRRELGRSVAADVELDLSALRGIVVYEPEELILVVAPATPMEQVREVLAERDQHLAFEPPDFGPLWNSAAGGGTIGGAILTGRNGPRRLAAGGARDHVLGIKAVNGFGDAFAAGGRVVKNVTGFDVAKLVTGSFGILCAVTEITLKVLPRPPDTATIVLFGLTDDVAIILMRQVLNETSAQISSAAHLPADVARFSMTAGFATSGESATLLRIEGFSPSVASRVTMLQEALSKHGDNTILDRESSAVAWAEIADAAFFVGNDSPLWRLSVPAAQGAVVGRRITDAMEGRCFYDLAGGAVWLEVPPASDAHATLIRNLLHEVVGDDGHATLIRAAADVRNFAAPFQPLPPAIAALSERVRAQFDPNRIFNPGRVHELA